MKMFEGVVPALNNIAIVVVCTVSVVLISIIVATSYRAIRKVLGGD